jgi:hypothetical protein
VPVALSLGHFLAWGRPALTWQARAQFVSTPRPCFNTAHTLSYSLAHHVCRRRVVALTDPRPCTDSHLHAWSSGPSRARWRDSSAPAHDKTTEDHDEDEAEDLAHRGLSQRPIVVNVLDAEPQYGCSRTQEVLVPVNGEGGPFVGVAFVGVGHSGCPCGCAVVCVLRQHACESATACGCDV